MGTERENYWDHPQLAADTAHAAGVWPALGQRKAERPRGRLKGSEKGLKVQRKAERPRERLKGSEKWLKDSEERQQPEIHVSSLVPSERESTKHTHGLSLWALLYLQHWNLLLSQQIFGWLLLLLNIEPGVCRQGQVALAL